MTVSLDELSGGKSPLSHADGDAEAEAPGEVLGHFRLVSQLGHGGMGTVYRALDESLQRYVALKVVREENLSAADNRHVQRLLEEAIAQARLNHPNIVHIYYVGRDQGRPFFAMELVSGPTLAERLTRGPLPFPEVVAIAEQLVSALQHATEYDIVHGDLKPGNVLLVGDPAALAAGSVAGTPKLADFGLARRLSEIADRPAALMGTPDYLAPEATLGAPLDTRSDLYALGVMLFEMTFGRLPFTAGGGVLERLRAHREAAVDFPVPWPESVPAGWRAVLEKLLAKNPDDRYRDYASLLVDVHRLRPATQTAAGRVPRGLAWVVDLTLANVLLQVFYAGLEAEAVRPFFLDRPVLYLLYALGGGLVLLLIGWLLARWGTTPGKRMFQLRVVDRHGLPPARQLLAGRMAGQLLPQWTSVAERVCEALGAPLLGLLILCVAGLGLVVDIGFALFRRAGRSLHDQIFRTRVVVDAGA
jgi:uncharacterized RDD family membrane protein YckC